MPEYDIASDQSGKPASKEAVSRKRKINADADHEPHKTEVNLSHVEPSPKHKKQKLDVPSSQSVKKETKSINRPTRLSQKMGTQMGKEPRLYFAALAKDTYIAMKEMSPFNSNDEWEVEKLRGKRIRILEKSEKNIKKFKDLEGKDDDWVQRVISEYPGAKDKIVVAEHKVHWCGWPDEDDTWEFRDSIEEKYAEQYSKMMEGVEIQNVEDIVFQGELFGDDED